MLRIWSRPGIMRPLHNLLHAPNTALGGARNPHAPLVHSGLCAPYALSLARSLRLCRGLIISLLAVVIFSCLVHAEEPQRVSFSLRAPNFAWFEKNIGQYPETIQFLLPMHGGRIYLDDLGSINYQTREALNLKEVFVGGQVVSAPDSFDLLKVHRFPENDRQTWQHDIPTLATLNLGEVWEGIQVELIAKPDNVEKVFTIRPGFSVETIQLKFESASQLSLDEQGNLLVTPDEGLPWTFTAPMAVEECEGTKKNIPARYWIKNRHYGFSVGEYQKQCTLVIDPLLQSNYLAGEDVDSAIAVKTNVLGDVYVAGRTLSTNFPLATPRPRSGGGIDIYVACFSQDLLTLKSIALIGGVALDGVNDMAIDALGSLYIIGVTDSPDFPGVDKTLQTNLKGDTDAFILKLSSGLDQILAATYLGGSDDEEAYAVAVDSLGQVYVAGVTDSKDFPITKDAAQQEPGGGIQDGFLVKLDPDLKREIAGSFIGGTGLDTISKIALFPEANDWSVIAVGSTDSENWYPNLGGFQTKLGGDQSLDAFILKITANLQRVEGFTYLGGSGYDEALSVAISPKRAICITGRTTSADFPVSLLAAQRRFNGINDAMIGCFDADLRNLLGATYFGGSGSDIGKSIGFLRNGDLALAGDTTSYNLAQILPGLKNPLEGRQDAFVARLTPNLQTVSALTYLGGNAEDTVSQLWVDAADRLLVCGKTYSSNFPGVVGSPLANPQAIPDEGVTPDGWITRLDPSLMVPDFQNGWWWNPAEGGRGFMIERRGDHIYLAGFLYHDDGSPLWFVSVGSLTGRSGAETATLALQTYRDGQTLLGPYRIPAPGDSLGQLTVHFTEPATAVLEWPGGKIDLTRFPIAPSRDFQAQLTFQPQTGWWWNPDESGRGYAIEVQGEYLFFAAFMYADTGAPFWYVASGKMTSPTNFEGSLLQYEGGQTIIGAYRPAHISNANVGKVKLNFDSVMTASLTLPDGRVVPIKRFPF